MQKSQLVDEATLQKKAGSQRHWTTRGRVSHLFGNSPADIEAFEGQSVNVNARVASQLRSDGNFDHAQYGPRTDGSPEGWIMIDDCLDLVR